MLLPRCKSCKQEKENYVILQGIYRFVSLYTYKLVWTQDFEVLNPARSSDLLSYKNVAAEDSLFFFFFCIWNTMKVQRSCSKIMSLTTSLEKVRLQFNISHRGSVLPSNTVKLYSLTTLFVFGYFCVVVQPIGHTYFIFLMSRSTIRCILHLIHAQKCYLSQIIVLVQ